MANSTTRSNDRLDLLRNAGIGRGQYVGAGFHRSDDLIAALLGILKSGAAYIPLDPGYPAARIAQMIASADLKTVVTTAALAGQFSRTSAPICTDDAAAPR